jgi:hypothetical protein
LKVSLTLIYFAQLLREGRQGEDDFQMLDGYEDDGEKWGGARILKVMKEEGILDAVVIVSRWCVDVYVSLIAALSEVSSLGRYGGIMLGPSRFTHIETCAREVCRAFKVRDEIEECVSLLSSLDAIVASLRSELNQLAVPVAEVGDLAPLIKARESKVPDYTDLLTTLDVKKARRLVTARENSIKSVKSRLAKLKRDQEESSQKEILDPVSTITQSAL